MSAEEQIMQEVAAMMQQGAAPEEIQSFLVEQGATPEQAKELMSIVAEQLDQAQSKGEAPPQNGQGAEAKGKTVTAEEAIQILSKMQIPPEAAIAIIKIIYSMSQKEIIKLIDALQGSQGAPPQSEGEPTNEESPRI